MLKAAQAVQGNGHDVNDVKLHLAAAFSIQGVVAVEVPVGRPAPSPSALFIQGRPCLPSTRRPRVTISNPSGSATATRLDSPPRSCQAISPSPSPTNMAASDIDSPRRYIASQPESPNPVRCGWQIRNSLRSSRRILRLRAPSRRLLRPGRNPRWRTAEAIHPGNRSR